METSEQIAATEEKSLLRRLAFEESNNVGVRAGVIAPFVIFGLMFTNFALRMDKDPETCYANYESDVIWTQGPKTDYMEVG